MEADLLADRIAVRPALGRRFRRGLASLGRGLLELAFALASDDTTAGADHESAAVRRAASGDHEAFTALIAPRIPRLIRTARKILRDPDRAEDATQQSLVAAWHQLPRLRDPSRFDAWLLRLLVNECYGEARRARRHDSRVVAIDVEPAVGDGADDRALRAALEAAFTALSPEHRAIIVLRHYADLPLAEVASIVGVAPGTARSRLHYGLRALRAALEALERPVVEEADR